MFNRTATILTVLFICAAVIKADDLNTRKMEQVTKEILEIFVSDKYTDKSTPLRKYISEEWLDQKKLNVKKYKINNYGPQFYNIIYSGGDVCIATIGSESWLHLIVFKFTEEFGNYRVVPLGISKASSDYIDPWFYVQDYVCSEKEEEK
ncbi:MAG TPA: hypothetical protein VGK25_02685 [Ignavibacteria bacterium]|jgi:hypothetical protein